MPDGKAPADSKYFMAGIKLAGYDNNARNGGANSGEIQLDAMYGGKDLEFVVANDVTVPGAGFGCDTNIVAFVRRDGSVERKPKMSKRALAAEIVKSAEDAVRARLKKISRYAIIPKNKEDENI